MPCLRLFLALSASDSGQSSSSRRSRLSPGSPAAASAASSAKAPALHPEIGRCPIDPADGEAAEGRQCEHGIRELVRQDLNLRRKPARASVGAGGPGITQG